MMFAVFFAIELITRLSAYRGWLFSGTDFFWNLLDLVLVAGSCEQFIQDNANWTFLRVMRVLHAVRMGRATWVFASSERCAG